MTDLQVPLQTLQKLPPEASLLGVYQQVEDLDGNLHFAIKCVWREGPRLRIAFFEFDTGAYLGDTY